MVIILTGKIIQMDSVSDAAQVLGLIWKLLYADPALHHGTNTETIDMKRTFVIPVDETNIQVLKNRFVTIVINTVWTVTEGDNLIKKLLKPPLPSLHNHHHGQGIQFAVA